MKYRAEITKTEQLTEAAAIADFEYIYAPMEFFCAGKDSVFPTAMNELDKPRIILIPPVFLGGNESVTAEKLSILRKLGFKNVLAHTLGHIELIKSAGLNPCGGFRLNITNSLALKQYEDMELADGIFSVELSFVGMKRIIRRIPMGFIAYGKIPLMVTRRCPVKDSKLCGRQGCTELTDRLGNKLQTLCRWGEVEILNPVPLVVSDKIMDKSADFCVLKFTDENISDILSQYKQNRSPKDMYGKFTRGLYCERIK
ncbi:MAG: hypothetical protein FWG70_02825 [Oscillospiraceae bacterium]|nr:hypothetical protein [Oscillospiraceae bacterium]